MFRKAHDSSSDNTEPLTFIQRLQLAEQTRFCNSMSNPRAMDRTRTKTREIAEDERGTLLADRLEAMGLEPRY